MFRTKTRDVGGLGFGGMKFWIFFLKSMSEMPKVALFKISDNEQVVDKKNIQSPLHDTYT